MAKQAIFTFNEKSFEASLTKLDRDKLYGFVEEMVTDDQGRACTMGAMLDDGKTIILSGSTLMKPVDESNREVNKKTLKTVLTDGTDAVLMPSVFDQPVQLEKVNMDWLFDLEVSATYQLTIENADAHNNMLELFKDDAIYRFPFNYRADYDAAEGILLSNGKALFVLSGRLMNFNYLSNTNQLVSLEEDNLTDEEETIDFGML